MCLYIKSSCKIEIAKEPIVCKKLLYGNKFLWFIGFWRASIMRTLHRFNKLLKATNHLNIVNSCEINEGFHAYISDYDLVVSPKFLRFAIIPKGSEYCYGDYGTIVSNKMIVFSSEEKFSKYMKKNNK